MHPPLALKTSGWFYAGGKVDRAIDGAPMVGQMYVEYMIPAEQKHPYPLIMIHGGGQTGTNYTGTPDGREGWAQYFVRRGYAVYVIDCVARGRSPRWPDAHPKVQKARTPHMEQRFIAPARYEKWPQAKLHTQYPGTSKPGDLAYDQFQASQFPSLTDFPLQQALNRAAGSALLDKVGPAILLTHSQGGAVGWAIADANHTKVKAIVAVEPSGPPVRDVAMDGAPDWFEDGTEDRISGIADVMLAYDPPLRPGEKLRFVRASGPDAPGLVTCWKQAEPARKLAHFQNIPVIVLMSEASYHAAFDHCTVAYLKQAGVSVEFIRLTDRGIRGNGHMLMCEKNSDDVAQVIGEWLVSKE
jgi:pimeloyl-ACP methyl ester carboxylesterase